MSAMAVPPTGGPVDSLTGSTAVPRRRGEALTDAIFAAVLDQLAAVGYDALTMEGVAACAHTGKASLYRRWPSKEDLVVAAMDYAMPCLDDPPDTGSLRGDLLDLLGRMAAMMNSPAGCAMQSLVAAGPHRDCGGMAAVRARVVGPRKQMMRDALRRGIERGEVRPDALTRRVAEVGPAMLVAQFVVGDLPITQNSVIGIVDEVVLPLVGVAPPAGPLD